ncbi:MAG: hypothetical protein KA369_07765 [Spirochaetes bacterium]|nr:hypothetical protein [Spirochaetota bacterium]
MKFRVIITILSALCLGVPVMAQTIEDSVVNILVTSQKRDYASPWQKGEVVRSSITGCVIEGNRILTASYSLTDNILIEVMKKGESRKYTASIEIKDYQSGVALLRVEDTSFFNGLRAVTFLPSGAMNGRSARVYKWDSLSSLKEYLAELTKTSVRFYDPSCGVLMHQFSTSMNEGGNGEPVFIDSRLAGIATGLNAESKTLFVISSEMVKRMIKDASDGSYEGLPFFWIDSVELQGDINLREYYGVGAGEGGVLVTGIPGISSGSDVLKKDDIILAIDGHVLDDKGNYDSPYGKLYYYGLIQMDHFAGEEVTMTILRNKKRIPVRFKLKQIPDECCGIPLISYDSEPLYYIFGGLVLMELNAGYMESFGQDWKQKADKRLLYYFDNMKKIAESGLDARVIILSRVLPDTINKGYQFQKDLVLIKFNGSSVKNLSGLKAAIDASRDRFIVLDFAGETSIVIDRELAVHNAQNLFKTYNINRSHNIRGN